MNDERFFELAMKAIARQSTEAERAELDACLANEPELRAEFERLRTEARLAKEILPLVAATDSTTGSLPGYARERLRTKVRETLSKGSENERRPVRRWQWWLGLASATALIFVLVLTVLTKSPQPVIQMAILDLAQATRSSDSKDRELLVAAWPGREVQNFSKQSEVEAWEKDWPSSGRSPAVKVIYDKAAGEVHVIRRRKGRLIQKTFALETSLEATLKTVRNFIEQQKIE